MCNHTERSKVNQITSFTRYWFRYEYVRIHNYQLLWIFVSMSIEKHYFYTVDIDRHMITLKHVHHWRFSELLLHRARLWHDVIERLTIKKLIAWTTACRMSIIRQTFDYIIQTWGCISSYIFNSILQKVSYRKTNLACTHIPSNSLNTIPNRQLTMVSYHPNVTNVPVLEGSNLTNFIFGFQNHIAVLSDRPFRSGYSSMLFLTSIYSSINLYGAARKFNITLFAIPQFGNKYTQ